MTGRLTAISSVVVAWLAVAACSQPAHAAAGEAAAAKAKEAATALQRGQAQQSVALYTEALADPALSNDRRAQLLNDRGVANARLNQLKAAIEDFNQSVRLAPEAASAYNNRGNVLLALGLAPEAEKDFDRALALAPGYAAAFVNRANARTLTGNAEGAARDFATGARLAPKEPAAFGGLGRLHLISNRPYAALRDFARAVGNDPRFGPGYRMRAEALVLLGRFDEAVEDLSRAIAFDAGNSELLIARGYAYLAARNAASAARDFEQATVLAPKASAGFEGLGLARARLAKYDNALDTLSKALELEPRSAQAYAYRALVYKLMGQVDLGEKDLDRAIRLEATRPEVLWIKGEFDEAAGRRDEAISELHKALAGRPHLRDAALALERLGVTEQRDSEVSDLKFGHWRVFVRQGRYYTTNADYPRLNVPLETASEGAAPHIVEFEVKGGPQAGIGILRFVAGQTDSGAGPEEVEEAAVIDLTAASVLAVETTRQGTRRASWSWGDDKLVVTGLDGFKQDYLFKAPAPNAALAEKAAEKAQHTARARPRRDETQAWVPWSQNWSGGGGGSSGRRRQPKTLFELLFSN